MKPVSRRALTAAAMPPRVLLPDICSTSPSASLVTSMTSAAGTDEEHIPLAEAGASAEDAEAASSPKISAIVTGLPSTAELAEAWLAAAEGDEATPSTTALAEAEVAGVTEGEEDDDDVEEEGCG